MKQLLLVAVAAMLAGAGIAAQQSTALEKLFASAEHKATVEGDVRGAISAYERIVETAGSNRAVAARALMRIAEGYATLGEREAEAKAYERIVDDYPDQRETAVARERLGAAAKGTVATLRTERVLQAGHPHGRISPDGRYLARPNSATGNLELVDIRTGTARAVTADGTATDPGHQFPLASAFFRDGRQIVYQWYFEDDNHYVLRVVPTSPASAGRARTIYDNPEISFAPTDWSPDGKWVAGVAQRLADRTAQIALVGVDGSFRALKTVEWSRVGGLRFAPDSSRLAFHVPATEGGFTRDVFVMTLGVMPKEVVVASSSGDDVLLEWAPDGRSLLVASDRGGTASVWTVPADGGDGGSQYELIKSDIGIVSSLGPTASGAIYYNLLPGASNLYVADFDFAKGQLASAPRSPLKQFRGTTGLAQWSSDGRLILHESWRDIPAPINVTRPVVSFVSADTGDLVREVPFSVSYGSMGALSPDGRTFIVRGADLKGRSGVLKVDSASGAATLGTAECGGASPTWAPDGGSFFCSSRGGLHQVDTTSGAIVRTFRIEEQVHSLSPDGRYAIYGAAAGGLKMQTLATGETRVLVPMSPPDFFINRMGFDWTPDGRSFVFYGRLKEDEGLWLVPIDGRPMHRIRLDKGQISSWKFNPTNATVLFSVGAGRWNLETWKLEIPATGRPGAVSQAR